MTVSSPEFDFLFSFKEKTEARIEKVSAKLAIAQEKLREFQLDPLTYYRERQIGKYSGLVNSRTARLLNLQEDLAELDAFIPKDEFDFNNFRTTDGVLSWKVSVTDSPYDDTYIGGENIRIRVSANKDGAKRWSTLGTGYNITDDTIEFRVGSRSWNDLTEDAKGKLQIVDGDGDVLYSIGYNNIV